MMRTFYKWRHKYLLNLHDRMAMVNAMPLKVECSNKISPYSYFYNINTFKLSSKSQFNFTHNFNDL